MGLTLGRHDGEGRWYLLDVLRAKLEFPELKAAVLEQQKRYRPELMLIENASLGHALLPQFRQEARHGFRAVPAKGSKEERFVAQTDFPQSEQFVLPRNRRWLEPLLQELLAFPEGSCNDQVDALSQACKWIRLREQSLGNRHPETGRRLAMRRRETLRRRGSKDPAAHSDQGSQHTSEQFQRLMTDHGVTCSMSRSGNGWDNSAMESFFSSLKTERTARKVYRTRDAARADVFDYVERFYNPTRRHSTLGYLSPLEFEQQAVLP